MGRHVVAGVDGSDSAALALDWAAADAGRRGLALRVVYVREPWAGEWVTSEGYDSLTVQVERLLER
ncbi:universal stress protein, partial [Nonomuraea ferruginea]